MSSIRVIETGIDISEIVKELEAHPEDWGNQKEYGNGHLNPETCIVSAEVLQLIMPVTVPGIPPGDSEYCAPTPAYYHHKSVINFVESRCGVNSFRRCGFLKLPVGEIVGQHIDGGSYYWTKDRYHLSIQGTYEYTVDGKTVVVEPGTFLWFDNKKMHGTRNIGDVPRITFVFDVPMNPNNP